MRRHAPWLASLAGLVLLFVLLPRFNAAQPQGIRLTRAQAKARADAEAQRLGIPVAQSWSVLSWTSSGALEEELRADPVRRRRAAADAVIGTRLGAYEVVYYRRGLEKTVPHGEVVLSPQTGEVLMWRLRIRNEEPGARLEEPEIRRRAEQLIRSRRFPGAPHPRLEDARPTRLNNRTDWLVRYRIASQFPTGPLVPYLYVFFTGDRLAGWTLSQEYADGRTFRGDDGGNIVGTFLAQGVMYGLLLVLLGIFLRKYHAGEVGVGTGSLLFAVVIVLSVLFVLLIGAGSAEGTQIGGMAARQTAWALVGFRLLFFDLPLAVLVFFAWAVGESYARERWGERLASFDAILRRDPWNATTGRSLLVGLLLAPAVAAGAFSVAALPLLAGTGYPSLGAGSRMVLNLGGPPATVLLALVEALFFSVVGLLFLLAFSNRWRMLALGLVVSLILAAVVAVAQPPIDPFAQRIMFGWGAALIGAMVFLRWDLLSASVALFGGGLLVYFLPLISVSEGAMLVQLVAWMGGPLLLLLPMSTAGLMSRRESVYAYEDLAPHVKRIVERERVKAEIDAANRIQAALLPLDTPDLAGASVASHYRAATEIGGDYFDFLPQPDGRIGIAFGDVSGHGLTSGIVMAMAKSALMVQIEHNSSPSTVLQVLNDVVIRTAPRRILMTFFFGLLDPRGHTLRFASAGHLDPYVFRASSRRVQPLSSWGFPLGVRRREPFREHEVEFSAGDRLVLYSDGLIEALDDESEPFGFERFERAILESGHLNAEEIKKNLLQAVRRFTHSRPPEDDQTLVVISFDEAAALRAVVN